MVGKEGSNLSKFPHESPWACMRPKGRPGTVALEHWVWKGGEKGPKKKLMGEVQLFLCLFPVFDLG